MNLLYGAMVSRFGKLSSSLFVIGGLLFLASLFLPWEPASCGGAAPVRGLFGGSSAGLLTLSGGSLCIAPDAWGTGFARPAVLTAIALIALVVAVAMNSALSGRLPLGQVTLVLAYCAVAIAVEAHGLANQDRVVTKFTYHVGYGAFLALGASALVAVVAFVCVAEELWLWRSLRGSVISALVLCLLVSFLLPWGRFSFQTTLGVSSPVVPIVVVLAIRLAVLSWEPQRETRLQRVALAAAVLLLTCASYESLQPIENRACGAWVGLGSAITLFAASVGGAIPARSLASRTAQVAVPAGLTSMFLVSLFCPGRQLVTTGKRHPPSGSRRDDASPSTTGARSREPSLEVS